MFDNIKGQEQNLKRKMERADREAILQMEEKKISLLEKLTILVEKQLVEKEENEFDKTKFTLNNTSQNFETKGYSYNTFVVSELYKDTIIEIEFDLERFEMILTSGFNRLNLPNGCFVKTKNGSSITVSLIRSKRKF
jgi:hypothetical protein